MPNIFRRGSKVEGESELNARKSCPGRGASAELGSRALGACNVACQGATLVGYWRPGPDGPVLNGFEVFCGLDKRAYVEGGKESVIEIVNGNQGNVYISARTCNLGQQALAVGHFINTPPPTPIGFEILPRDDNPTIT